MIDPYQMILLLLGNPLKYRSWTQNDLKDWEVICHTMLRSRRNCPKIPQLPDHNQVAVKEQFWGTKIEL